MCHELLLVLVCCQTRLVVTGPRGPVLLVMIGRHRVFGREMNKTTSGREPLRRKQLETIFIKHDVQKMEEAGLPRLKCRPD